MQLGFIVNPIAGMGGRVALKGTDNVLKEAIARGAEPIAPRRAMEFMKKLKRNITDESINVVTCPGIMGEQEAKKTDFPVKILPMRIAKETTAQDTKIAVDLFAASDVDLIVFVGGDGTATDIFEAMQRCRQIPVIGVPAGVKMYSGIFAVSPSDAVEVVLSYARGLATVMDMEIVDADEKAIRSDFFALRIHGFLKGPFLPARVQGSKQVSSESDDEVENQRAIGKFILEQVPADATWILGPGTTVKEIAEMLGVKKTILGIDIVHDGKTILDVDEKGILREVKDWNHAWMVLSPIGRQGILLGRGNQQLSPRVLKRIHKEHIIIAATKTKLQSIDGSILRIDTGDSSTDEMLKGYVKVVTDYREWRLMRIQ